MPRRKQQMTAVEALILVAILGILAAITMPAMQRAKQQAMQAMQAQPSGTTASQQVRERAGQLNTIEVSEVASGEKEPAPEVSGRAIGALIRLAMTAVIVVVIINAFRRRMKSARQ